MNLMFIYYLGIFNKNANYSISLTSFTADHNLKLQASVETYTIHLAYDFIIPFYKELHPTWQ
jgi:hypothetical protein